MLRRTRGPILSLLGVAVLAMAPTTALAQLVDEEAVGRLTIGGGIGILLPSMTAVNENISTANPFFMRDEVRSMDKVNKSLLTGLDVRYRLKNTPAELSDPGEDPEEVGFLGRFSIGFTWGAVSSESGFDVSRVATRFFARATTYFPYVMYHLPWLEGTAPRTQLYVGGGPMLLSSGTMEWAVDDRTNNNFIIEGDISELAGSSKATGSGLGVAGFVGAAFMLNSTFSVALDVGYRAARIDDISLDEAVGQEKRFPGDDGSGGEDIVRRPDNWAVIDFWKRNPDATWNGQNRNDLPDDGGCQDCPLYYQGGPIDVDFSGPYTQFYFRVHFF